MADDYLDDSQLVTTPGIGGLKYDDIETGGSASIGEHLALIKKIKAQKKDWPNFTGVQAVVLFTILEGPDKGKTAYDRIPFYHEKEEEWMKTKRLLIAKRTGLISRESKDTETINFKLLEGMKVIIAIEENTYQDKTTKQMKTGIGLNTFKSYRDPSLEPKVGAAQTGAATSGAGAAKDAYQDI
jgi:hypothetical protein